MTPRHWSILGACLLSVGTIIGSLSTWEELARPGVIAGLLGAIGSTLAGVYSEKPTPKP